MTPAVRLRSIVDSLRGRRSPSDGIDVSPERQVGSIPYTLVGDQVVFLLITSRRTGRWVFPKGALAEGMTPWGQAAMEALEEAGVEGAIDEVPVGAYRTVKTRGVRRSYIDVDLYPMKVERQLEDWPERGERYRHWVTLAEARRLLSDERLVELAEIVAARAQAATVPPGVTGAIP